MMGKLKVRFEVSESRFVWLIIEFGGTTVDIWPLAQEYNSLHQLLEALYRLRVTPNEEKVLWETLPGPTELRFVPEEDIILLEVLHFPGRKPRIVKPEVELSLSGSYDEVCLPFWRAFRQLQGQLSPAELDRWCRARFPIEILERLTAVLGK